MWIIIFILIDASLAYNHPWYDCDQTIGLDWTNQDNDVWYNPVFDREPYNATWTNCMKKNESDDLILMFRTTGDMYGERFKVQIYLREVGEYEIKVNYWIAFHVYNKTIAAKKRIVRDINEILHTNGKPLTMIEYWSRVAFSGNLIILDRDFIFVNKIIGKYKINSDWTDYRPYDPIILMKCRDIINVFENDKYMILVCSNDYQKYEVYYTHDELVSALNKIIPKIQTLMIDYKDNNDDYYTESLFGTYFHQEVNENINQVLHDTFNNTWKILKDLYPLLKSMTDKLNDLESKMPTCDWNGGKWIYGNNGCEDDIFIICKNKRVKSLHKKCD